MSRVGEPAPIRVRASRAGRFPLGTPGGRAGSFATPIVAGMTVVAGIIYFAVGSGGSFLPRQSSFPHHLLTAYAWTQGRLHLTAGELERRYIEARLARAGQMLPRATSDSVARVAYRETNARVLRARGLSEAEIDARVAHFLTGAYHDWVRIDDRFYAYWPPLPALLALPLVWLSGPSASDVLLGNLVGAATIPAIYFMLAALRRRWSELTPAACVALTALYAFGTVHLYQACLGQVWFLTQLCGTLCLILAIGLGLRAIERPGLIVAAAAMLGLGFLARSTIILAAPFLAAVLWLAVREGPNRIRRFLGYGSAAGATLTVAIAVQLAFNFARFGDPLDFGQGRLADAGGNPRFADEFKQYGRFHTHYIANNFKYYFTNFSLRYDHLRSPGVATFDPNGNSLFMVTPAMIYLLAFARTRQRALQLALVAGAIPGTAALMLFHGTGWYQFGHRYLLDVMPFLLLLAAFGMRGRLTGLSLALISASIAVNAWGTHRFCFEQA